MATAKEAMRQVTIVAKCFMMLGCLKAGGGVYVEGDIIEVKSLLF